MACDGGAGDIVHAGPAQAAVAEGEAAGFDDVEPASEAGGEANHRTQVLRNVGLVKRESHGPLIPR